ncbi:MAG: DUF2306 domain-containing protein [Sphingomonadales bacterium]|nr:DUF2306 domain-containing protein [Sphingomonadales bacterium]
MERSSTEAVGASGPLQRAAQVLVLAAIAGLVTYTAGKAVSSAFANDDFPESLAVKVELLPLIFPLHMITGGLALLLLPLALVLRHRPAWHRLVGRLAAADVLISGLTAFPVAWAAPVTIWSAAGFTAQATTWLVLLVLGIRAIRQRRIAAHRTCMILMVATTSGAVFFRVYLALWALFGARRQFDTFYACDAWIAWLLPLALTALMIGGFGGSLKPLRALSARPART